jgi:hypothetical protein
MGPAVIIIVIFLVVWIVSNVIRAQQDASQAAARRSGVNRQSGAVRAPEKTSNTDIDRFLQEIDRLRKKGQPQAEPSAQKEQPVPTAQRTPVAEQPRSRSKTQPKRSQPSRGRSSRSAPPPEPAPVVPVAARPSTVEPPQATAVEMRHPDVQPPIRPSTPARPTRPGQAATPMAPALQMLQTLFKDKQSAAVAILLHEILGKPKSKQ